MIFPLAPAQRRETEKGFVVTFLYFRGCFCKIRCYSIAGIIHSNTLKIIRKKGGIK